jgi:hypothetical protein
MMRPAFPYFVRPELALAGVLLLATLVLAACGGPGPNGAGY